MASSRGIRKLQTHDASGHPAEEEHRFGIPLTRSTLAAGPVTIAMDFIAPLHPFVTDDRGILGYTEPGRGSGWLILELNDATITEITDRVQLGEDRFVGQIDPQRVQNTARPSTPPGRNPLWLIATGVLVIVLGVFLLSFSAGLLFVRDAGAIGSAGAIGAAGASVLAGLAGLVLGAVGIAAVRTGRRRRSEWIRARADAYR